MLEKVLVSIVIPIYNVECYIERAILSCLNQKGFDRFEVLLIDDCGSDGSVEKAKSFCGKDDRLKLVHNHRNLGTFHARRVGVESAEGELIVFLDPDDELALDALGVLYKEYSNCRPDILLCDVSFMPKRPWYKKKPFLFLVEGKKSVVEAMYSKVKREFIWGGAAGKVYDRSFLLSHIERLKVAEGFRFVYMEDNYLFFSAMATRPKCKNIRHEVYVYHKNENSITMVESDERWAFNIEQYTFFILNLERFIRACDLPEKDARMLASLIDFYKSGLFLISRNLSDCSYIKCVFSSFRLDPKFRKVFAILMFIITFGKVRF
ncbi:glycosyltransferase family 2 protein [Halomonas sp. V046]|uniref:glycosyltransferase family 2 protein n=1 Tax=Halomonas sp. V046 TaxID=3459611 RepID=UPI004043D4EC